MHDAVTSVHFAEGMPLHILIDQNHIIMYYMFIQELISIPILHSESSKSNLIKLAGNFPVMIALRCRGTSHHLTNDDPYLFQFSLICHLGKIEIVIGIASFPFHSFITELLLLLFESRLFLFGTIADDRLRSRIKGRCKYGSSLISFSRYNI